MQFWTFDEWNTVHFWISTGTVAASFMSLAFAFRQYVAACAVDFAVRALSTKPFVTGLL
jgi:hypothetical protein